jgi:hypothetical protein
MGGMAETRIVKVRGEQVSQVIADHSANGRELVGTASSTTRKQALTFRRTQTKDPRRRHRGRTCEHRPGRAPSTDHQAAGPPRRPVWADGTELKDRASRDA